MGANRLSALDATFLSLDVPWEPAHAGILMLFDGNIELDALRETMNERVNLLDRYRQLIVRAPFNLAHPSWEFDPKFDIRNHIEEIGLTSAVSLDELKLLALDLHRKPLEPDRPLWRMTLIRRVEGGRSAIFYVHHHAMSDGMGDAYAQEVLFDDRRDGPPKRATAISPVPPLPSFLMRLASALTDSLSSLVMLTCQIPGATLRLVGAVFSHDAKRVRTVYRRMFGAPAMALPFNGPMTGKRTAAFADLPIEPLRALGRLEDATMNDVLLGLVAEGISAYCQLRGVQTEGRYLRIMMPMNLRPAERNTLGNELVSIPVPVPMGKMDFRRRLREVRTCTKELKETPFAAWANVFTRAQATILTPILLPLVYRLIMSPIVHRLVSKIPGPPLANLVVSNVRRSGKPSFLLGRRVEKRYIFLPLMPNTGLMCVVNTGVGELHLSVLADDILVPDVDRVRDLILEALNRAMIAEQAEVT